MFYKILIISLFLAVNVFSYSFVIISPNGGETFTSGKPVKVEWIADSVGGFSFFTMEYSIDNGNVWRTIETVNYYERNFIWTPFVNKRVDKAIFRISLDMGKGISVQSDSSFTILPSADSYEPNNRFSSAWQISAGDSVVKDAFVFGKDSSEGDNTDSDIDFYKLQLDAGKILTISLFSSWDKGHLNYDVYDSLKSLVYSTYDFRTRDITKNMIRESGTYFIKIWYFDNRIEEYASRGIQYGMSIHQQDTSGLIKVIYPNGGETFSAEQLVTVNGQEDTGIFKNDYYFNIQYSIDSGNSWVDASMEWDLLALFPTPQGNYGWRVPHLKKGTGNALIRISPKNIKNPPFAISNKTFTILPSPNDSYEPNDNFASAREIGEGDSVVDNAIVMKSSLDPDSNGIDTSRLDVDYYKLNLTAGKQLFITGTLQSRSQPYRPQQPGGILIRLYDVSKNQVAVNYETLIYTALQSGSYYCEISSSGLGDFWNKYRLSVHQYDPFTLISPNGGENFEAGQKVTVRYKGNSLGRGVSFSYSIDNRKTWIDSTSTFLGYDSTTWIVPALKTQNSQVEMKIEVQGMADKLFDISDNTFTIQAVPNDQYEPNNSMASAYSVSIGDSVVTNASTCRYLDSVMLYDYDYEYYKVYLKAGSLLRIPIWNTDSERSWDEPEYDVFDSSGLMEPLPNNGPVQIKNYIIENSGVYFIEVYAKHAGIGDLVKYGMSIKPVTILASSNSILDTNAMTQTLAYSDYAYKSRVTFDKTSLTIDFLIRNKIPSIISKMELNPEDFDSLPGEIVKVKAFAIYPYSSPWGLLGMTVSVPYNPSVLNGFSAKHIAVAHQDLSIDKMWNSLPVKVDTLKHQIIFSVQSSSTNLFQIYVTSDSASASSRLNGAYVYEKKLNIHVQKKNILVNASFPNATTVTLQLYDIQGKVVKKGSFPADRGYFNCQWNLSGLAGGKYILYLRAGSSTLKTTCILLN